VAGDHDEHGLRGKRPPPLPTGLSNSSPRSWGRLVGAYALCLQVLRAALD
jgi:hypothetical protein